MGISGRVGELAGVSVRVSYSDSFHFPAAEAMRCLTESRHGAISDVYGDRSCDSMITRLNGELSITFLAVYSSTFRFDDERYRHLARNMP